MAGKDLDQLAHLIVMRTQHQIDIAEVQESVKNLGRLHREIAEEYRALGICALLTRLDADAFHQCLVQAAITRRHYLRRCHEESEFSHVNCRASLNGPFFDAVAANQLHLASEIAELSPRHWREGFEYPEDFQCSRVFYGLVLERPDSIDLEGILVDFEEALDGTTDQRLSVCQSLVRCDQVQFEESFDSLVEERMEKMDKIARTDQDASHELVFEPNRLVFVEGLAVLRLAEERGLATKPEYSLCPASARLRGFRVFEPISWPYEELELME